MVGRGGAAVFVVLLIAAGVASGAPALAAPSAAGAAPTTTTTKPKSPSTTAPRSTSTTGHGTTTTTEPATSTTTEAATTTEPSTSTTTVVDTTTTEAATTTTVVDTTTTEAATTDPAPPPSPVEAPEEDPLPDPAATAPPIGAEADPAIATPADPVASLAQFTYVAFAPWRDAVAHRDALVAQVAALQARPETTIGAVGAVQADLATARAAVTSLAPGYRFARDALADAVVARAGRPPADAVALSAAWERSDPKRLGVVLTALMQVGDPYVFAAAGPDRFDCSGLTQYAWRTAGVNLVHYAITQRQQTLDATTDSLLPGDLVFRFRRPGGHVMLYLGIDDLVVEAGGSATGVVVTPWGSVDAFGSPLAAVTPAGPAAGAAGVPPAAATALFGAPAGAKAVDADVPFADAFNVSGARYGVAPSLLAAIAGVGTGYRGDIASAAATTGGLMQLRPAIAAELKVDPTVAAQAIDGAARRLVDLWSHLHDAAAVIAAYRSSLRVVSSAALVPTDAATTRYVAAVLTAAA